MKGYIRRLGVDRAGRERWLLRADVPRMRSEKLDRVQRSKVVYGDRAAAKAELSQFVAETEKRGTFSGDRDSFGSLLERWLSYQQSQIQRRTLERYQQIVKQHIPDAVKAIRLAKLDPQHLAALYSQWKKSGLSPRTIRQHHAVMHAALARAVRWNMMQSNPADRVEAPATSRFEAQTLSDGQIVQLLNVAKKHYHQLVVPIVVAIQSGLRRGELLGLRWSDVNLKEHCIVVRQSLEQCGSELAFKSPKNGRPRAVEIAPPVMSVLKRHKKEQIDLFGSGWRGEDLVFPNLSKSANGGKWRPDQFTGAFKRLACKAGMPRLRFHDLRHTHATLQIADGVNITILSKRLGHSSINITADLYGHLTPEMQHEAAQKMASRWERISRTKPSVQ